jgi:glycosyltransferase involved in cell wall biosynthesis
LEWRGANEPLTILIPVFNDWESLDLLLRLLDKALAGQGLTAGVLVVDDGSTMPPIAGREEPPFLALRHVDVLTLRQNLGHQRALALGITFVEDCGRCEALVVMDGDGEDDASDVPRLVARSREDGGRRIVFAERTRRSESAIFRIFYVLYKLLHVLLTGSSVRVGNFSVIPRARLTSLVVVTKMWNHYAAAAFHSRQPIVTIPSHRAQRLRGKSSMNFTRLVIHGLSAISVYSEIVAIRVLIVTIVLIFLDLLAISSIIYIRLATKLAIPGWATVSVGILTVLFFNLLVMMLIFVFILLSGRDTSAFLPKRDFGYFLAGVRPYNGDLRR